MTYLCTVPSRFEQGSVVIRRLRSLGWVQAGIVAQAIATFEPNWRVDSHNDYDGYLSLVVSSDDENAPTFAISGKADAIELSEVRDDALHSRGCFGSMDDAAGVLVGLLQSL